MFIGLVFGTSCSLTVSGGLSNHLYLMFTKPHVAWQKCSPNHEKMVCILSFLEAHWMLFIPKKHLLYSLKISHESLVPYSLKEGLYWEESYSLILSRNVFLNASVLRPMLMMIRIANQMLGALSNVLCIWSSLQFLFYRHDTKCWWSWGAYPWSWVQEGTRDLTSGCLGGSSQQPFTPQEATVPTFCVPPSTPSPECYMSFLCN